MDQEQLEADTQKGSSWMHSIKVTLGSLDHREVKSFISSIPIVPDKLRKFNEQAYTPKLITIGPLHRETRTHHLAMEEHKWRYMLALLHRTQNPVSSLDKCGTVILGLDDAVRASYGGKINLHPHEHAKIMLVDGCFLLELLLRCSPADLVPQIPQIDENENNPYGSDSIFKQHEMLPSVLTDLILLENQIPFFILKALARILFPNVFTIEADHLVAHLALSLFGHPLIPCSSVAHFLHLMHFSFVSGESQVITQARQQLKHCATRLTAHGVTIRPAVNNNVFNRFDFGIRFSDGVLEIPPLYIDEATEVYWRNFIAWEQRRIGICPQFTSYALFFRGLICSIQDIELLVGNGVIVKDVKISNKDLLALFKTITRGVELMDSSYNELCEKVNTYSAVNCLQRLSVLVWHCCGLCAEYMEHYCRRSYKILIDDHIPNVWKLIGVLAAMLLLALTIMQTYYSANN
ncbi:hypothetical protein L6164_002245 [Bauhinia variegata]|uniref:Uncharacterized protein n=1 Tax=Bauhinia variegata TaxID=167791 RepID=A0ACB9PXR8_BAUVA|nr:hypothetical protein L6164_002245 [Bauhinia variegata]